MLDSLDWFGSPIMVEKVTQEKKRKVNPCLALYGVGTPDVTCKHCVYLHRYQQSASWMKCDKCPKNKRTGDHKAGYQSCAKYERGE